MGTFVNGLPHGICHYTDGKTIFCGEIKKATKYGRISHYDYKTGDYLIDKIQRWPNAFKHYDREIKGHADSAYYIEC